MSVVSTGPVAGLSDNRHIMNMMPASYMNPDGTANDRLKSAAKSILPGIFAAYRTIQSIVPEIIEGYDSYNSAYDSIESEIATLRERKKELRLSLKGGNLDSRQYQEELTQIKKEISNKEYILHGLFEDTFHLKERCGYGIDGVKGVVERLTGKTIRTWIYY